MDAILRQIGELLVNSIPTIISVLILWTAYTFLVHNKLRQILEQRHALTEGAIERAQQEIAIAEKRTTNSAFARHGHRSIKHSRPTASA
jgi:F-type H+-transporting ATPase subunit b